MEASDGKWIQTMDDGVLLFKNITNSVQESSKADKGDNEYQHSEANCLLEFEETSNELREGQKYYHSEKNKICILEEVNIDEPAAEGENEEEKKEDENKDSSKSDIIQTWCGQIFSDKIT